MAVVCRFLESVCRGATRVYCVGDLFDYWLGPPHAKLPGFQPVLTRLGDLVRRGVRVEFIHGNRDFQVGRTFSHGLGIPVHRDGLSLLVAEQDFRIHVCHGDLFCTRDTRYQLMRRLIRGWIVREIFGALPMRWREPIAQRMRGASKKEVASKSQDALGIVPAAVARCFDRGYDAVICGHVHREERIAYRTPGSPRTLFTLGDWDDAQGSYLVWQGGEFSFQQFTI